MRDGTVKPYDGDMETYRQLLLDERGGRTRSKGNGAAADFSLPRSDQRRAAAGRRAELAPLKKQMQRAEKDVERLTAEIAALDAELADPELYARDPAKAQNASVSRGKLAKALAEAEEAWLAASEAYESQAVA